MAITRLSLAEQIYIELKQDIVDQNIAGGEKLTLKVLQERFQTSSTPVRDAIMKLSQDGLVEQVTNVGARVVEINDSSIREVYDLCGALDSFAVKQAALYEPKKEIDDELSANIAAQEAALERGDSEAYFKYSNEFHDIFYKYAGSKLLQDTAHRIDTLFSIISNRYKTISVPDREALQEHKAICNAFLASDVAAAAERMVAHFAHNRENLLENYQN